MSGTITNGLSALIAAQRALQATSNNIANANTAGYVRQRVEFVERPGTPLGQVTIGAGVAISDVARVYDQFLTDSLRSATSLEQRYTVFSSFATRLDSVLGNPDTGIGAAMQRFFNQVEAVGRDPTSIAQRQQLLLEGDNLATRFQQLESQLNSLGTEINNRLQKSADTISQLAGQLADVNDQIISAGKSAGPDLLDRRDELLKALGGQIDITTIRQVDGSVNVMVGSGQSLVLGNRAATLTTIADPYDGSRLQLAIDNGTNLQSISSKVSGGVVGGLLAFRNDVLDSARRDIGQLAIGIADAVNSQHRLGMDLNGNLGTDVFSSAVPLISGASINTGSAVLTGVITDARSLAGRDYELRFNGTAWSVLDQRSGAAIPATGAGTTLSPLVFEGMSVTATGGAAAGDRYLLRPVVNAAQGIRVLLDAPDKIAAAAPLTARVPAGNLSQATVSTPSVTDIADPKLRTPATILFTTPNSYVVFTGTGADQIGPLPYTSGGAISFAGWTATVSGQPQAGDSFLVSAAGAGSGDNTNILALSSVSQLGFFVGGSQTLADLGADIVATVGSVANRASNEVKVQQGLLQQAEIDLENVSGVNLDEEAANMLRYQQAYLAASKVISIADNLFHNLLQVLGR
ncbi:MAG: flagellar hook-associated protein FlgK [Gammaproteobacteria bacterium]|nr:flagellar hook-associated protein FlgK [Gammaproteobacteria bacterium]